MLYTLLAKLLRVIYFPEFKKLLNGLIDLKQVDTLCLNKVYLIFKQFVVTNCRKERPGSIVNETLKNEILILKYTSKESEFHADFKCISFSKFSVCHQKLQA